MLYPKMLINWILAGGLCFSLFFQSSSFGCDELPGNDMVCIGVGGALAIVLVAFGLYATGGKYQMPEGSTLFPGNYIRYRRSSIPCQKINAQDAEPGMKNNKGADYLCPDKIERFKGKPYTKKARSWFREQLRPTFNKIYRKSKADPGLLRTSYHVLVSLCANVDQWNKSGLPLLEECLKQVFKEIRVDKYNQQALNGIILHDHEEVFEAVCSNLPEFSVSNSDLHALEWKPYCLQSGYGNSLVRQ